MMAAREQPGSSRGPLRRGLGRAQRPEPQPQRRRQRHRLRRRAAGARRRGRSGVHVEDVQPAPLRDLDDAVGAGTTCRRSTASTSRTGPSSARGTSPSPRGATPCASRSTSPPPIPPEAKVTRWRREVTLDRRKREVVLAEDWALGESREPLRLHFVTPLAADVSTPGRVVALAPRRRAASAGGEPGTCSSTTRSSSSRASRRRWSTTAGSSRSGATASTASS